jgi:hypothetical protein
LALTVAGMRVVSCGISVIATSSEAASERQIVTATCDMYSVMLSCAPKMFGRNTMAVASVPSVTARPTLFTPPSVAPIGLSGCSLRALKIASFTTTALSTSMPTDSISPISVRMLRL